MINKKRVGDGKVYLIAGGGKTYCDIAAKFCRTEKDVESIVGSSQSKAIIHDLISSGHSAALEFDTFIFGIEGYSRVTEVQLVRKRHASYMIKSGRNEKNGKRNFDMIIPESIEKVHGKSSINPENITLRFNGMNGLLDIKLNDAFPMVKQQFGQTTNPLVIYDYDYMDIFTLIDNWYRDGLEMKVPEEELRYMKPQATEFKAAVLMNGAALRDIAKIRMCNRAQEEIRDLVTKMVRLATEAAPELMEGVGPSCKCLGYCPEQEQCEQLKGVIPTKAQALAYIGSHRKDIIEGNN